ncbi:RNA-binding domain-containing protein [Neocallimastix lanati (nom. inval.)]|jgi:RNA recognition motif-containing protein|uniref:RNA-binding domain-containing protein n=1 Tax=Neocallimastix californiae TaxID=1754190 RepID=A0A1Y2BZ38_9FUNG|nr:RNA-binding domain-containing protein [Neocallimastix sp. JGI-2020a]ORY40043.1 RNA-binding domain-containing protein [Neocallimastix californiae]|eukprot:ORY40043.1 RNA-binding domain-containing protein [Neocallimastix californiae]
MSRRTLFVAGIPHDINARELAYEFERYGRLVRSDIPRPRYYNSTRYAFVEFEDPRDAEDAFYEMHGRKIRGCQISIQWAKSNLRSYNSRSYSRSRSRSPYYRRRRSYSRSYSRSFSRSRSRSPYSRSRSRSRSYSRSDSRTHSRTYSRSKSYSRSPSHSRSYSRREPSRGRSRTPRDSLPLDYDNTKENTNNSNIPNELNESDPKPSVPPAAEKEVAELQ